MQNFYIVDLARYLPKSSPRWLFDLEKFLGGINDDRISLSNYPKTFVDTIVNRQASGDPDTAAFMAATMLYGRVAAKSGLRQMVVSMGLILGLISAAVAEAELPEVFGVAGRGIRRIIHGTASPARCSKGSGREPKSEAILRRSMLGCPGICHIRIFQCRLLKLNSIENFSIFRSCGTAFARSLIVTATTSR
jgi:hypothetical protein